MKKQTKGFTLVELLIVIAIIAIIAAVMFVALDPLTRFRDARDSARWSDISALVSAIKIDQVDNGGQYVTELANAASNTTFMIGTGTSGCDADCDATVASSTACLDLSGLVTEGYLGDVPVSPTGETTWTASTTGYTIQKSSTGTITIGACESENSDPIYIVR